MIVVPEGSPPPVDPTSRIRIPIDTPMRRFYAEHVAFLDARDHVGLVENHYREDAIVMSVDYVVVGRAELLAHFAKYAGLMAHLEVVTTDKWTESETTFAFDGSSVDSVVYACHLPGHFRYGMAGAVDILPA